MLRISQGKQRAQSYQNEACGFSWLKDRLKSMGRPHGKNMLAYFFHSGFSICPDVKSLGALLHGVLSGL